MYQVRKLVLAALTGFAIACTDGALPTNPSSTSPSFELVEQGTTAQHLRHEELKALLRAQKERIKQQKELRKAEFEVTRAAWKLYRQELKRARKGQQKLFDLLRCEPRPYNGEAAIVGPDGGTLHIGEHELVIPRGALTQEELIVAEAPTSSLVEVEFYPEGLMFQRPAELTVSYKHCDVPAEIDLRLAYLGWGNRILELPPSQDRRDLSEVIGEINHFSRYAVAY
jgi:hypothetical protein